jgi:hypothetical protein
MDRQRKALNRSPPGMKGEEQKAVVKKDICSIDMIVIFYIRKLSRILNSQTRLIKRVTVLLKYALRPKIIKEYIYTLIDSVQLGFLLNSDVY